MAPVLKIVIKTSLVSARHSNLGLSLTNRNTIPVWRIRTRAADHCAGNVKLKVENSELIQLYSSLASERADRHLTPERDIFSKQWW